jgi:hypothetical protein
LTSLLTACTLNFPTSNLFLIYFVSGLRNLIGHECVTLSNIQVVKERSLKSCYRDQQFPESCMPFYLFGTSQEQHIEHMLLRAPNVQISADRVHLDVQPPLSAA